MEPTIEKLLQNIPFAGMGSTLERNGLIGVIRELIKANKYTVDYILNYCESVGYQRNMTEQVFEELTGLSPKLIINNNEYYNAPIYVPACTIAWGLAKTKPNVAFYVVPGSYGYSVMEKNETEAPVEVIQMATIPEAIDELKKVAKKIQTLDKIITSKLLETENVATIANDIDQTSKPYAAVDPIFELKKNFKNKVIDANGFEREAKKLVAEEKITVDQAEDLMAWKQDLIDEDESYANEVLQNNEEWKPLEAEVEVPFDKIYDEFQILVIDEDDDSLLNKKEKAKELYEQNKDLFTNCDLIECVFRLHQLMLGFSKDEIIGHSEYEKQEMKKKSSKKVKSWTSDEWDEDLMKLDNFEYIYSLLVNGNIDLYKQKLNNMSKKELIDYMEWAEETGISKEKLGLYYITSSKKIACKTIDLQDILDAINAEDVEDVWVDPTDDGLEIITYDNGKQIKDKFTREDIKRILNLNDDFYWNIDDNDEVMSLTLVDSKKQASKKVTAENMTLEDMEDEDNKTEVEKEVEKIDETPIDELLQDTAPLDYFDEEIKNDKVDTINDVVSKCITEFSDKFKDFDKYDIKILSYKTKILDPYTTSSDEMIPDNEVNADAVLQVILAVNNKADNAEVKKLLAVFSITDGKMHWTGTVRDENDKIVAFTDQGLDSIFNDEEVEDVEEVI